MATLFVILENYDIEDHYHVQDFAGIYDSREKAEAAIVTANEADLRRNYLQLVFQETYYRLLKDEKLLAMQEEHTAWVETKPKFDQAKQFDRTYVREHTERKNEWASVGQKIMARIEDSRNLFWKLAEIESARHVNDPIPEIYDGQIVKNCGRVREFEIKEIELNKEI